MPNAGTHAIALIARVPVEVPVWSIVPSELDRGRQAGALCDRFAFHHILQVREKRLQLRIWHARLIEKEGVGVGVLVRLVVLGSDDLDSQSSGSDTGGRDAVRV